MAKIDMATGFEVAGQFPQDYKLYFKTLAEMQDLGVSNAYAYKYYESMIITCVETNKQYIWREVVGAETGVLVTPFTYPNGIISDGIDYSNRVFNFFLHESISILPTGFELIDEGNGNGWRLIGRDPSLYGNIGLNAVDASTATEDEGGVENSGALGTRSFAANYRTRAIGINSSAFGHVSQATGENAFSIGFATLAAGESSFAANHQTEASGAFSSTFGRTTKAEGSGSFAAGYGSVAWGNYSVALGSVARAGSYGEVAVGMNSTIVFGDQSSWVATDRAFSVGVGSNEFDLKDGLIVLKNGLTTLPTVTNTLINAASGKAVVTKEWVTAQGYGTATGLASLDEGNGIGWRLTGFNPAQYGNIGLGAVDLSVQISGTSTTWGATGQNSFATNVASTASGLRSTAMGYQAVASGVDSVAIGTLGNASGQGGIKIGYAGGASGVNSVSIGNSNTASGVSAVAIGNDGSIASGNGSIAIGTKIKAFSFGEISVGMYGSNYTPLSTTTYNALDRAFSVGAGAGVGVEKNVLTILKNGTITADSLTTTLINTAGAKALITKEYADANYSGGTSILGYNYSGTEGGGDLSITVGTNDAYVKLDQENGESTIKGTNAIKLLGNLTGTATSGLGIDATGKIVQTSLGAGASVDDTAFTVSWNGVTTIAPSKNAVYDMFTNLVFQVDENSPIKPVWWGGTQAEYDIAFPSGHPSNYFVVVTDGVITPIAADDITFTSYNTITSNNIQNAIEELKDELDAAIIGVGTGANPVTRVSAGETTWNVGTTITPSHKIFIDSTKLVEGIDYTKTGSVFTFTGYIPTSGDIQEYYPDIAVPATYNFSDIIVDDEVDLGNHSIGGTPQVATGDGTTTIDWKLGNMFNFQFGAFNEVFTFTAPTKPGTFILKLVQDSIGSRTATFPATVKWSGGTAPTLTTTATTGTDIITFYFDGSNYFGVEVLNFS